MRRGQRQGLSRFQAGLILIAALVVISYLGFTKAIPFRHHWAIKADFNAAPNVRVGSFVRIAGVNVGKVTAAEPLGNGKQGVRVTLRIDEVGRPIHKDATVALRPNIFLEGNTFMDLKPGSPTQPVLSDGETIPPTQTTIPVQIDQVLTALQADTREQLQTLLHELSTGLYGRGGIGYNRSIQYWLGAFRGSALVNDATLGIEPHDLSGYLSGQGRFARALDRNPPALKSLISDFNTTAEAFARERVALRDTLTELPRTLRTARPALAALNRSFPPLRRLTSDLRPATRSTGPMIDASLPFITQLRLLVGPAELQGLSFDLRQLVPDLARLNAESPHLYEEVRLASSCQNKVILPWSHQEVGDPNFPPTGEVYQEGVKGLPGLAEESRAGDANGQWARVIAGNGLFTYALDAFDVPAFALTNFLLEGSNPPKAEQPEIRYDKDCETQEVPNLDSRAAKPLRLVSIGPILLSTRWRRMGEIGMYEFGAQMLDNYPGGAKRAREFRAKAKVLRARWGLEDTTLSASGGKIKLVDEAGKKDKDEEGEAKGEQEGPVPEGTLPEGTPPDGKLPEGKLPDLPAGVTGTADGGAKDGEGGD